ncbi:MAG: hypothetical protein J7639_30835 [Paenibacillaceae bacterium]|nr:hypothetical protein [Paenibacillaceae bacterium]
MTSKEEVSGFRNETVARRRTKARTVQTVQTPNADKAPETDSGESAAVFTKAQLLASKRLAPVQKDALQALLQEERNYSFEDAIGIWTEFMKREVV